MWWLLLILLPAPCLAHVTLTFPEARYPPLDFLDTARTLGTCGIPKSDRSVYSTLKTGLKYNITWRLQYPHQGGFRISLIDYLGNQVEQLSPEKSLDGNSSAEFAGVDDQSLQWKEVEIQSVCPNCTLVLERQASEWGGAYKFKSCAEVHVVEVALPPGKQCMGRGSFFEGVCKCDKSYSGNMCQYETDCESDKDCFNGGRCVADGIVPNKSSCFCKYGHFGRTCREKSFPVFAEDQCFNYEGREEGLENFKYGMFDESCYKSHNLTKTDVVYTRVLKDELEVILDYETESYVALGWRPGNIPKSCRLFPDLSKGKDDTRLGGKTSGYAQSALDAGLHGMDCTDIVMASVVYGDFLHIEDMYTRDRSTPLSDNVLDGEQSLNSAYGIQRNGRTVVMFRRGIREIEPSDHPLGPGRLHVIHAKGQKQSSYQHFTPSAIETHSVKNANFYKNDQWKYHGSENRGVHRLEFVGSSDIDNTRKPYTHLRGTNSALQRPPTPQFRDQVLPRPSHTTTSSVVVIDLDENPNTSESPDKPSVPKSVRPLILNTSSSTTAQPTTTESESAEGSTHSVQLIISQERESNSLQTTSPFALLLFIIIIPTLVVL